MGRKIVKDVPKNDSSGLGKSDKLLDNNLVPGICVALVR